MSDYPPAKFLPVPGSRRGKVFCSVCFKNGYPGGAWENPHRRGHKPCPTCGKPMSLLKKDGPARRHARCPRQGDQ